MTKTSTPQENILKHIRNGGVKILQKITPQPKRKNCNCSYGTCMYCSA